MWGILKEDGCIDGMGAPHEKCDGWICAVREYFGCLACVGDIVIGVLCIRWLYENEPLIILGARG
jgi:hypothetical protein